MSIIKSKVFRAVVLMVFMYLLAAGAGLLNQVTGAVPDSWRVFHMNSQHDYMLLWMGYGFVFSLAAWLILTSKDSDINGLIKIWIINITLFTLWAVILYVWQNPTLSLSPLFPAGYCTFALLHRAVALKGWQHPLVATCGALLLVQVTCWVTSNLIANHMNMMG